MHNNYVSEFFFVAVFCSFVCAYNYHPWGRREGWG